MTNLWMILLVFGFLEIPMSGVAASARATCRVDYIQTSQLFSVRIQRSGRRYVLSQPTRVYDLRSLKPGARSYHIAGTTLSGDIYVQCDSDLWRLRAHTATKLLSHIAGAALSPRGDRIAFNKDSDSDYSPWIMDSHSLKTRRIAAVGIDFCWAQRSDQIAFALVPKGDSYEAPVRVLDVKTGRILFQTPSGTNPRIDFLSSSGRYLAVCFHLSRPIQGDTLFDTRPHSGRSRIAADDSRYTPPQYIPAYVEDWSPDERWILWDWRIPDQANDGTWLRDFVGLTSVSGRTRLKIVAGTNAQFALNGQLILFCRSDIRDAPGDLAAISFKGKKQWAIAHCVTSYDVVSSHVR